MLERKLAGRFMRSRRHVKDKATRNGGLPENYEIREGQGDFIQEIDRALKRGEVFLGSAPCGIGKSLASILAVLSQLEENKLIICFRTRSQLHIYLKELKALSRNLSAVSFFSKQDMCPLQMRDNLSYFDFFEECKRLKENCESSAKPYCKFYLHNVKSKREADDLAMDCARRILSPDQAVRLMAGRGFCAYEALKGVLHRVKIFLGTYHYIFSPRIRQTLLKSLKADLSQIYLIADEAHNIPSFARELLSDRLTTTTVERALKETEAFEHESTSSVREYLTLLAEEIFQHAQQTLKSEELRQLRPQEISDFFVGRCGVSGLDAAATIQEYGEWVKEKRLELSSEKIRSYSYRIGVFMENFFENCGIQHIHLVSKDQKNRITLKVRNLDGREITNPVLRQVKGSILMSGFLSPPEVYRDLTLYESHSVHQVELDSPFPPENRLLLVARDVSSEFKRRTTKMLGKWKDYIEAVSNANEGNMAVFFTSYGLMHKVLPLLRMDRRTIIEKQRTKRDRMIEQLAKYHHNVVFGVMGGKFSEGIDYPNNILKCVIAVGLPYATWDIYQKALIDYYEQQFPGNGRTYAYSAPAVLRLIQTCGRVHRSAEDKGCIAILDNRVAQPNIKQQLPSYFQKELRIVNTPQDCAKQVRDFWGKRL